MVPPRRPDITAQTCWPDTRATPAGEQIAHTWLGQMRNLERDGSLDQSAAASCLAAIRRRIQKGGDSAKPTDWGLGGCPLRGSRRGHGLRDRPGGAPRSPEQCGDRRDLDQSSRDPQPGTIAALTSGGSPLSPRAAASRTNTLTRSAMVVPAAESAVPRLAITCRVCRATSSPPTRAPVPSTAFCPPSGWLWRPAGSPRRG
jgi:hypothetical protein